MSYIDRTIDVGNLKVRIVSDDDSSQCDPRDSDCNGSLLFCWLRNHNIGDDLRKNDMPLTTIDLSYRFEGWSDVEKMLVREYRPLCIIPVYASIHSNIHIWADCRHAASDDFDSSQVGFIFDHGDDLPGSELRNALNARLRAYEATVRSAHKELELLGRDPDELEAQLDEIIEDYAEKIRSEEPGFQEAYSKVYGYLEAQVEVYNDWMNGNVWGWVVEDEHGDTLESCWGFIGDPSKSGVIEEGVSMAKWIIENEAKQERLCAQAMHL